MAALRAGPSMRQLTACRGYCYGAGASASTFEMQLRVAGESGASGFLVGRTIWLDTLRADPAEVEANAVASALPRFIRFGKVASEVCRPLRVAPDGK